MAFFKSVPHQGFPIKIFANPPAALIDLLLTNLSILKMSPIVKFNYVLLYLFPCWLL